MAEYIERTALLGSIADDVAPLNMAMVFRHIHNAPAADVAPVRHGEWIPISDGEGAECSECGEYYCVEGNHDMESFKLFCRFYRFCPSCGAKMSGVTK